MKSVDRFGFLCVLALSSLASACIVPAASGGGGQPTQYVVGDGARTTFEIQNVSGESICYVHISSTNDSNWGPDRLGATEVIGSGVRRSWTLPVGNWDFRFQDCQHSTMMERRGVGISGSGLSVTFRTRE